MSQDGKSQMERHIQTFREEAADLLAELEAAVLELEEEPDNRAVLDRIFRAMHTIKGSGAMFGFEEIAGFTHYIETVLDKARSGQIGVTKEIIDLVLASRDQISLMLEEGAEAGQEARQAIVSALSRLIPEREATPAGPQAPPDGEPAKPTAERLEPAVYRIRLRLPEDSIRRGVDPLALLRELATLGGCHLTALTDRLPELTALETDRLYIHWDAVLTTTAGLDAVRDVFIFVDEGEAVQIQEVCSDADRRVGDILVERRDISRAEAEQVLGQLAGERLVAAGAVSSDKVTSALKEQAVLRRAGGGPVAATSIRVAAEKLDRLINLVGELVITRAQLVQNAARSSNGGLLVAVENIERITDELRDCVLNVRMLPIGSTFEKFKRLVRDLAAALGKEVDLAIEGGETELDKTVIERINDPLVHLIRNSIDHGIETPEERVAAGKPRRGTLRVSAGHAGGCVVINVEDDGRGLDRATLLAKAQAMGIVDRGQELSESEACNLIFHPGLSTARAVSDVSGRGVGMDVVKREIVRLRGRVEIASSPGQATTVSMKLPLTLAIIDGLLIEVSGARYVVPLSHVRECVELTRRQVRDAHGRHLVRVRGELVPYVRLRQVFGVASELPEIEQIVIVEDQGLRVGLVADSIISNSQAVIKALGRLFGQADGVSGATILGDGTVALIIDVAGLVRLAQAAEAAAFGGLRLDGQPVSAQAGTA